ncbi:Uncharacterized protein dnl_07140 [Desulfonema limicola]|uniref:Uncharacterized protein n=1 Tax=Desulfonema limicola TaxID=45656 RepID=A0A975GER1_9BACT|nr:hypothetical protein [Desulfonema limicola]QTA78492.1 Uncharacterized protein dnl_07140 [Desulfonema limicola]
MFMSILALSILGLTASTWGYTVIGITGDVWEIAEPDPVEELKKIADAKKEILQAYLDNERNLNKYVPAEGIITIPPAQKSETYIVNTVFTLDHDITDQSGSLIYPAGFKYNILDYRPFPLKNKYVIFNGASKAEIAFVFERFGNDPEAKFFVTRGTEAWLKTIQTTGGAYEIKFLTREMADILHIKATISVVYQVENYLKVDVVPVPEQTENPASYQD